MLTSMRIYRMQTTTPRRRGGGAANPRPPPRLALTGTPPASTRTQRRQNQPRSARLVVRQTNAWLVNQQQLVNPQRLVAEVKGIYKGIVLVEAKCIEVDSTQEMRKEGDPVPELNNEQWQALGALHRALLHEHYDFFLASQHPYASPALTRLAANYRMPARMWRHGIHTYLELLRHRLPQSREHMLTYIYTAYHMMCLLYETILSYKETWIECLGDLGRYRMAIEDNVQDRETWTEVSRQWYRKASDLSPGTGRLYHHLAILAQPNWIQQLLYYSKALCVPNPFDSAREPILTLFKSFLDEPGNHPYEAQQQSIDPPLVRSHACMFMRKDAEKQRAYAEEFLGLLDYHIARTARLFLQPAYTIGIANCCAMVEYGSKSNVLLRAIDDEPEDEGSGSDEGDGESSEQIQQPAAEFFQARDLACGTARLILDRFGDPNVWPFVHVTLVFVYHLTFYQEKWAMTRIENSFPWTSLVNLLNTLHRPTSDTKYESATFPGLLENAGPPLPEDFAMRGLLWSDRYHPGQWMAEAQVDDDDRGFELASMAGQRRERIL